MHNSRLAVVLEGHGKGPFKKCLVVAPLKLFCAQASMKLHRACHGRAETPTETEDQIWAQSWVGKEQLLARNNVA